jgi:chloride channel 2
MASNGGEIPLLEAGVGSDEPLASRDRSTSWDTLQRDAEVEEEDLVDIRYGHTETRLLRNAWDSVSVDWDAWTLLFLLGIVTALTGYGVDRAVQKIHELRFQLLEMGDGDLQQMTIWVLFGVGLATLAFLVTHFISPAANGSGIPEMKAILSGARSDILDFPTLASKTVGLTLALGSGLVIGKEGPFVHIASCIASLLTKVPMFSRIRRYEVLYLQILAAGVSVGVSSTFGAPIGGVLFAIEVTRVYFLVSNYWMGFFCAACGAFFYHIGKASAMFEKQMSQSGLIATDFGVAANYRNYELLLFCLLGATAGLIAAVWVQLHARFIRYRKRLSQKDTMMGMLERMRYPLLVLVSLLTALVSFPNFLGPYMAMDDISIANSLFGPLRATHGQVNKAEGWHHPSIFVTLFFVFSFKFFACLASITLPVPCGMYMPMFACGGVFGRFIGEFAHIFDASVVPGGYALVGAAALAGGVTRTISSAVIVFEVTGELRHILPVLLSVLISTSVGNMFSLNIYDSISNLQDIPALSSIRKVSSYKLLAKDVMDTTAKFITKTADASDILVCLQGSSHQEFAVVESRENPILVGTVERQLLEGFMFQFNLQGVSQGEVGIPELEVRRQEAQTPRSGVTMLSRSFDPDSHDPAMNINVVLSPTTGLVNAGAVIGSIPFTAPHQVLGGATLPDVFNQFIMLGMQVTYVTNAARVEGVISREMLIAGRF